MKPQISWRSDDLAAGRRFEAATIAVAGGYEPVIAQAANILRSRNRQILDPENAKRAALELRDKLEWLMDGVVRREEAKGHSGMGPYIHLTRSQSGQGWAIRGARFFSVEWLNSSFVHGEVQGCVLKHFVPHRLTFFLSGLRIKSAFYHVHRRAGAAVFTELGDAQIEAVSLERAFRNGELYLSQRGGLFQKLRSGIPS